MPAENLTFRPMPFYFLTTNEETAYSREEIGKALDRLKEWGFGGCVLFNKPPTGFSPDEFLGDKWFRILRRFAEEALTRGLALWINDGFDYPPGDAGGRIQKLAPHLKQVKLVLKNDGSVAVVDGGGAFPCFEEPESSALFIKLVYEETKRQLGDFFGTSIVGFFSDADNRRVPWDAREPYYPWSTGFAAAFEQRYGYSIEPHLPAILRGEGGKATRDYWHFAGWLYQQWFANNQRWCQRNNLKYTFHSGDAGPFALHESVRSSIFTEGDGFELHAHADYPGTDHELRSLHSATPAQPAKLWQVENARWGECKGNIRSALYPVILGDVRAKMAASAAYLDDKARTLCECFAGSTWGVETAELRQIVAWQIMQGVNLFVPHAVHHRFQGGTKYFAPPEFMRCGVLKQAVRALNDHIEEFARTAAAGELLAPVALLAPTDEIWRTGRGFPRFFELCVELDRLPYGYVLAPLRAVLDGKKTFAAVVNPGLALAADERDGITRTGALLLEENELDRLAARIPLPFSYVGTGRPHYMRRLTGGRETVLLANIDDAAEIGGQVTYYGEKHPVVLMPGEIAVFAPDRLNYRQPLAVRARLSLEKTVPVKWSAPNALTLFRWVEADSGQVKLATENASRFLFKWKNVEDIPSLRLLAPEKECPPFLLDGVPLAPGKPTMLFDDPYLVFELPGAGAQGDREISVAGCGVHGFDCPFYLEGDFDCEVVLYPDIFGPTPVALSYYNYMLWLPQRAWVYLSKRRQTLETGRSWVEQGHPFYSGLANYAFTLEIPVAFKKPALLLGGVHTRAELVVNGRNLGSQSFPPFIFSLDDFSGKCQAELTVENTLANRLDGYGAPSGLSATPELVDLAIPHRRSGP
jgi:hypothetical protein